MEAIVRKIDVDIGQLLGSLLGGDVSQENMGEHIQGYLGALTGGVPEGIDTVQPNKWAALKLRICSKVSS